MMMNVHQGWDFTGKMMNVCKCEKNVLFTQESTEHQPSLFLTCAVVGTSLSWFPVSGILGLITLYLYSTKIQSTRCARSKFPPFPKDDLALTAISEAGVSIGIPFRAGGTCAGRIGGPENGELYVLTV